MNKLVIIGNGFDLAHGLKTSYSDFILWHIDKVFYKNGQIKESSLIKIDSNFEYSKISTIGDLTKLKSYDANGSIGRFKLTGKYDFINKILKDIELYNWVDIENKYFENLLENLDYFLKNDNNSVNDSDIKEIIELNAALDSIKTELSEYLKNIDSPEYKVDIEEVLLNIYKDNYNDNQEIRFLNFNYTSTIEQYMSLFDQSKCETNYIHGDLINGDNPMIFGYGDESNKYFEKIESFNNNKLTRHLKSFLYLTTSNYRKLFAFLGQENKRFRVYVLGHSLGLSDRLLLKHIFEHEKFEMVNLYFYEYEKIENGKVTIENDYFHKTQELSRHFDVNSKHKMRIKVLPFNKSKPLTRYKPKES